MDAKERLQHGVKVLFSSKNWNCVDSEVMCVIAA